MPNKTCNQLSLPHDLMKQRERNGRCGICGNQIYRLQYFGYQRESLTISNVVCNGRCLLCYPMEVLSITGSNMYNNGRTITTSNELLYDDIDDSNIPIALAIPFEMIEHCDAVFIGTEAINARYLPEPSAPPKEDDFFDNDDYENESIDNNLNVLENSDDHANWASWYIIGEEDIRNGLNEKIINISRKNNLQPKLVLASYIAHDKLSSMIDYGAKNIINTLANANATCAYHHKSEINLDSSSMFEIELKEFVSPA